MKTRTLSLLIVCCVVGLGGCHAKKEPIMMLEIPDTEGTTWTYTDGSDEDVKFEITKVSRSPEGDRIEVEISRVFKTSKAHSETLLRTKDGLFRIRAEGSPIAPPFCLFQMPFLQNSKWDVAIHGGMSSIKGEAFAHAPREITVPAGKFKAFEVSMKLRSGDEIQTLSTWYASGVGMIQTVDGDNTLRLKSFVLGKR